MPSHLPSASSFLEPTTNRIYRISPGVSHRARRAPSRQDSTQFLRTTDRRPSSIAPNRRSSLEIADKAQSWSLPSRQVALSSTVPPDRSPLPTTSTPPARVTHPSAALLSTHGGLPLTHPPPTRVPRQSYIDRLGHLLMTTTTAMKSRQRKTPGEQSLVQALRDSRTDPGTTPPSEPISPACWQRADR